MSEASDRPEPRVSIRTRWSARPAGRPDASRLDGFRSVAASMWEEIPRAYRAGVEALVVEEQVARHPDMPAIFTMGECISDHWPSAYSEEGGDVRSRVVLYHGSFRELAARDPAFDWRGEMWETLLHELLHHREFAAAEEGLEVYDAAVDHNFRRRAGRPFDPNFYRWVPSDADGVVRLESETFVETRVAPEGRRATFRWREREYGVRIPAPEGVLFVNPDNLAAGRLWVVVRRRRPWWRRLLGIGAAEGEVRHLRRRALPVPRP